jgi:REP element-mobilizing transposase RayT
MRHRFFAHLVWTTRQRASLIDLPRAHFLQKYLPAIAHQERAQIWAPGIVSTHVHLLLRIEPATEKIRTVQRFKGGSSALMAKERIGGNREPLKWAKGYNLESVSPKAIDAVREYVQSQAMRHPNEAIRGLDLPGEVNAVDIASAIDAEPRL